ncbi:MAG: gamma-glutamyltransferase [Planctomycetales bacterium]|nr:gamma-glutamyltransferase [Planctomycetales bacterium]
MHRGVIAAGHERTVQAAERMLRAGGNAFDAVLAAHFVACVVEPVLASLAGGGFLIAKRANREAILVFADDCREPANTRRIDLRQLP